MNHTEHALLDADTKREIIDRILEKALQDASIVSKERFHKVKNEIYKEYRIRR